MKVEIIPKPGRKEIFSIFIEEEFWKEIHTSIFGRQPSFSDCSSVLEWPAIFAKKEYERVRNYVLWRLSSQNYHSAQLSKLLKERLVTARTIEMVISEFQDKGFLNDQAWIESFIRSQRKRLGLPAVMRKLQAKGISNEELRDIQAEWRDPEEELRNIAKLLQTRYRSKDLSQLKEKQKVIASLMRKGFAYELIQQSIQKLN